MDEIRSIHEMKGVFSRVTLELLSTSVVRLQNTNPSAGGGPAGALWQTAAKQDQNPPG